MGREWIQAGRLQQVVGHLLRLIVHGAWASATIKKPPALLALLCLLILSLFQGNCCAYGQSPTNTMVINREYTIKAAFLYHFSTYVEWPPKAFPEVGEPFVIGVFKSNPFGTSLDQIAQTKTVSGRPIKIRRVANVDEVHGCHILFVPATSPAAATTLVLQETSDLPVLVVGETDDFLQRGGEAQFFLEQNKVRFAFNPEVVAAKQLKVSSKLLSLAKIVSTR